MAPSPPRRIERVSSRVKGKYTSGENLGNVEAVADVSLDEAESGRTRQPSHPYGLRRIFSNPVARRGVVSTESRLLRHDIDDDDDEEDAFSNRRRRPYGLRRIFSDPSEREVGHPPPAADSPAPAVALIKTKSYHSPSRGALYREDDDVADRMPPSSLVRRVSRIRYAEREVEVEIGKPVVDGDDEEDDDTFVDSVDAASSSFSSSSSSSLMKRATKRLKQKTAWLCLVGFFGMAGVGVYLALSRRHDGKNPNGSEQTHSSFSSSMETAYWDASDGFHSESSFHDSTIANVTEDGRSTDTPTSDSDDANDDASSRPILESDSIHSITPTYLPTAPPPLALLNPTPSPLASSSLSSPPTSPSDIPPPPSTYPPAPHPSDPSLDRDSSIVFYVMADSPYSDRERQTVMPDAIDSLPHDAEYLFHLGDLEYKKMDRCAEWAYRAASGILRRSRVPVFVVPGDNDLNDCEDHDRAERFWTKYYGYMDTNWSHSLSLTRWGKLDESFSFLRNRILFFGINIVGGKPYDDDEKTQRHAEHLRRLKGIMSERSAEYDVAVLLGHAEPKERHADLFEGEDGLARFVSEMEKPFVHIHGDYHCWYEKEKSFGVKNYLRISLDSLIREDGEVAVPIRVEIDSSKKYGSVKISRGRSDWEVECCSEGWPRVSGGDDDDDDDEYVYSSSSKDARL